MDLSNFPNTNRAKVLIIDDEVDLCLLMRQYFWRKNYEVFIAHTAADGIQRAEALQPQYIIASCNLPDGAYRLKEGLRKVAPNAEINMLGNCF